MIPALVSTLLAVGPCAPVEPKPPDAELASVYAAVAAEEEAQGATDAAAAAWRSSAELDPDAGVATHALTRLCREEQARVDFEAGLALFESGDCPAALPRLEAARVGVDAAPAALMVGICAYELSDEPRAIEALLVARALPALAATADLYLGLIALRGGEPTAAAARLRSVSLDPGEGLHSLASELLALTERRERLVIDGALEAGYDSNAPLAAFATVLPGGGDDAMGSASVNLSLRPLRANGPYLTVGGAYRKYLRFPSYDVGLVGGSLGGSLTLGRLSGSVDYGLDFVSLGAVPWLLRNRGTLRLGLMLGTFFLSAEYLLRYDALYPADEQSNSGLRHLGRLGIAITFGTQTLELAPIVIRTEARVGDRSSIDAGGELRWTTRPTRRFELTVGVGGRGRIFDALDADLGVLRREFQLDGQVRAEVELSDTVALFAVVDGRRVFANVAELSYTRLASSAGVRLWLGVW